MRQCRMGIYLYRWFAVGCVTGCVLMNLLLDHGFLNAARAAGVMIGAVGLVVCFLRRFPFIAVVAVLVVTICLTRLCRIRRGQPWLFLIVLMTGAGYAGMAAILIRGMIIGQGPAG